MVYLKSFYLPTIDQEEYENLTPHAYPYAIFPYKELRDVQFGPITIFYGSNGSGKSTLLNLIAEKIHLPRNTLFNTSSKFSEYVKNFCDYSTETDDDGLKVEIPLGSRIITSEDVFNSILSTRDENKQIDKRKEQTEKEYYEAKYNRIRFQSLSDYETLKMQNAARSQTATRFIRDRAGVNLDQYSNGETALSYFDKAFEPGRLYLLDEPENSLSPKFQLRLSDLIMDCAHFLGCQFIIASHSPFILSMKDALIYDLDAIPAAVKNWHELENMKIYYKLFQAYHDDFES